MRVAVTDKGPLQGRRVAVTGLGAVSCAGIGIDALWATLLGSTVPSEKRVPTFDNTHLADAKEIRRLDPFSIYALAAADEAWRQSGLEGPFTEGASIVTVGLGGLQTILDQSHVLREKGSRRVSPLLIPMMMPNAAAAAVSMRFGLGGPCETVTTACAAGTHAIGNAARLIASGRSNVAVTGGTEAVLIELASAAFANMTALSSSGFSRPFDVDHDGFVMAEGAGILVLEDWEHALNRGATILAEVIGAASTADAFHVTAPNPDASGAVRCIETALADADITADDVSHINAHGTSTPLNDAAEATAIRHVFGTSPPPITSNKGHLGHALGAAGALEAVASVLTLLHQVIPPTAGTVNVDPRFNLDVVLTRPRQVDVDIVLSNSFGFGGHNGSILLSRYRP
jgi:3-oxoacyl-[acyl-carrier-protein] synthase II